MSQIAKIAEHIEVSYNLINTFNFQGLTIIILHDLYPLYHSFV